MSCRPHCPPAEPIICPTAPIIRDFFHPQILPVIHPIEIVNRHHCVPIPRHFFTFNTIEEGVATISRVNKKKKRRA
ncbi:hypothetical protein LQV63_20665 [Paenibacillus profundus]|uniref:Spore coat protein D n=1 Tax=Paenibacillus profundus TaxID=1173085 RepID=A0ABS8YMN1_9BACL|nr:MULTISPECIES: hypothetical protein [Paenibacillus]MCE5171698.1 hypothetical protein [Paenibacillus profundus]